MNRQEIRNRILYQLNDSISTPDFWDLSELDDTIQEAQEILAEEVQSLKATAHVPRQDGTMFYSLAAVADNVMSPLRVWLPDEQHRLRPTTMRWLNRERQRWMEDTTDYPDYWFPVSWYSFGVYPGTTTGRGLLAIDYLQWPDEMISDSDEPEFPLPDHDALVIYGVYAGLMKQWDIIRAVDLFTQFVSRIPDASYRSEIRKHRSIMVQRQGQPYAHSFIDPG